MGNCWQACNTTEGKSLELLGQSGFYLQASITLWVSKPLSQYSLLDDVKVFPVSPEERQEARQHNCRALQAACLPQSAPQPEQLNAHLGEATKWLHVKHLTTPSPWCLLATGARHQTPSVLLLCIKRPPDTAVSKHSCCPASPGMPLALSSSLEARSSSHPDSPLANRETTGVGNWKSGIFR